MIRSLGRTWWGTLFFFGGEFWGWGFIWCSEKSWKWNSGDVFWVFLGLVLNAGNFREWSIITDKNHPSNLHSHPFPTFSTRKWGWNFVRGFIWCSEKSWKWMETMNYGRIFGWKSLFLNGNPLISWWLAVKRVGNGWKYHEIAYINECLQ